MQKLKFQYSGHLIQRTDSLEKHPDAGKDWRQKKKGTSEDKRVGWHHRPDGHEFEQAPGVGDGQGGLACCSPWGHKGSDTTERLNRTEQRASLVAQMVKNPPAMQESWVWSLGWEDPHKEGPATHSSILPWRIPMDRGAWRATVHGVAKNQTQLSN